MSCQKPKSTRAGCPADLEQWEWKCGFYPGIEPSQHESGTAIDFDHARAAFKAAWRVILLGLTEADFRKWRCDRDRTAENMPCGSEERSCHRSGRTR